MQYLNDYLGQLILNLYAYLGMPIKREILKIDYK